MAQIRVDSQRGERRHCFEEGPLVFEQTSLHSPTMRPVHFIADQGEQVQSPVVVESLDHGHHEGQVLRRKQNRHRQKPAALFLNHVQFEIID